MQKINSNILRRILAGVALVLVAVMTASPAAAESIRKERKLITSGNSLYKEGKFTEAMLKYKSALEANANSDVARFNLGLTRIKMAQATGNVQKDDSVAKRLMAEGVELMTQVARLGNAKPDLSAKANYNLGNLRFDSEDYAGAIALYKQALRLNPQFENARRNLRIAQLRQQEQQDNNDDNKDQNQNQQDQNQDQQDQNQDQQQDQQDQQQEPRENESSQQAAQQILNAVENNEAQTRARKGNSQGQKAGGAGQSVKKW